MYFVCMFMLKLKIRLTDQSSTSYLRWHTEWAPLADPDGPGRPEPYIASPVHTPCPLAGLLASAGPHPDCAGAQGGRGAMLSAR